MEESQKIVLKLAGIRNSTLCFACNYRIHLKQTRLKLTMFNFSVCNDGPI